MTVKIETKNVNGKELIFVSAPYNWEFIHKARRTAGKWDKREKAWRFRADDEGIIRDACMRIYGDDGAGHVAQCDVRVDFTADVSDEVDVDVAGFPIAKYSDGDDGRAVRWVDGVIVGDGSRARFLRSQPRPAGVKIMAGSSVTLHDFPADRAKELIADPPAGMSVEVTAASKTNAWGNLELAPDDVMRTEIARRGWTLAGGGSSGANQA